MALKDIYPALRSYLLGDAAILAVVAGVRIHVDEVPQGQVTPSLVLTEISNIGDHHNEGPSGLARPRIQITSWAQDRDVASALSRLVKDRLDGFGWGTMGSGGEAVTVQAVFFDNSSWIKDDTAGLFGRQHDYVVTFEER